MHGYLLICSIFSFSSTFFKTFYSLESTQLFCSFRLSSSLSLSLSLFFYHITCKRGKKPHCSSTSLPSPPASSVLLCLTEVGRKHQSAGLSLFHHFLQAQRIPSAENVPSSSSSFLSSTSTPLCLLLLLLPALPRPPREPSLLCSHF